MNESVINFLNVMMEASKAHIYNVLYIITRNMSKEGNEKKK